MCEDEIDSHFTISATFSLGRFRTGNYSSDCKRNSGACGARRVYILRFGNGVHKKTQSTTN